MSLDTIFWEVTNRCNLSCTSCYNQSFLNDKRYTLDLATGESRCREIIASGAKRVVFLGGEPLADRNIFHYMDLLYEGGVRSSLSTNGTLINDCRAARLVSCKGLDLIVVSIDGGTSEVNDAVRGAGTFDRIVSGLKSLSAGRVRGKPRVGLALTIAEQNACGYSDFFQLAASFSIRDIFVNKFMKFHRVSLTIQSAKEFLSTLDDLCAAAAAQGNFCLYLPTMPRVASALGTKHKLEIIAKEQSCPAVDDSVLLSDDGKVYPCSISRILHPEFGTRAGESLLSVENAVQMKAFVDLRRLQRKHLPDICKTCEYVTTCAVRCAMAVDQTKYHLACEALAEWTAGAIPRSAATSRKRPIKRPIKYSLPPVG